MPSTRFLTSLVPAVLLLAMLFGVVLFVGGRLGGMGGVLLGILAGACIVLGVLLGYWNLVDWTNLRTIRRTAGSTPAAWADGSVIAAEGLVRVDGEPLVAPFSRTPCAAYTYVLSHDRQSSTRGGRRRQLLAQGYHLARTRLECAGGSVRLCAFPGFSDALREAGTGGDRGEEALRFLETLAGTAPRANEGQVLSGLLDARRGFVEEVRRDFVTGARAASAAGLTAVEEVLPVDRPVCVIGTWKRALGGLGARRGRIGPNLIVYPGTASEVIERVGKELRGFARAAIVLVATGVAIVGYALLRGT